LINQRIWLPKPPRRTSHSGP